jgi:hypothetical protein
MMSNIATTTGVFQQFFSTWWSPSTIQKDTTLRLLIIYPSEGARVRTIDAPSVHIAQDHIRSILQEDNPCKEVSLAYAEDNDILVWHNASLFHRQSLNRKVDDLFDLKQKVFGVAVIIQRDMKTMGYASVDDTIVSKAMEAKENKREREIILIRDHEEPKSKPKKKRAVAPPTRRRKSKRLANRREKR